MFGGGQNTFSFKFSEQKNEDKKDEEKEEKKSEKPFSQAQVKESVQKPMSF